MTSELLSELAVCKASDPYKRKPWAADQRGKWMTVNVPTELWERIQAAARPAECVGKDPRGCWNVRCQLGEACCRIHSPGVGGSGGGKEDGAEGVRAAQAPSQVLTVAELAQRAGVKASHVMRCIKEWGGGDVTLNQPINLIGLATAALSHGVGGTDGA